MSSDARTRAYVTRRLDEGLTKPEIMRVLKRYVAREIYRHLPRTLAQRSERRAWPDNCPTPPAVLRTICRPAAPPTRGTAWPNKSPPSTPSGPSLVCQHRRNRPLTTHRSIAVERRVDASGSLTRDWCSIRPALRSRSGAGKPKGEGRTAPSR